jgi:hypothetical protein
LILQCYSVSFSSFTEGFGLAARWVDKSQFDEETNQVAKYSLTVRVVNIRYIFVWQAIVMVIIVA